MPTIRIDRIGGGYDVVLQEHATRQQVRVKVLRLGDLVEALGSLLATDQDPWRDYDSPKVDEDLKEAKGKKR